MSLSEAAKGLTQIKTILPETDKIILYVTDSLGGSTKKEIAVSIKFDSNEGFAQFLQRLNLAKKDLENKQASPALVLSSFKKLAIWTSALDQLKGYMSEA